MSPADTVVALTQGARPQRAIDALLPMQAHLPIGLRATAVALLRNPATRPDHLLILADALRELAMEHRIVGFHCVADEVEQLILRLHAAAPLLA